MRPEDHILEIVSDHLEISIDEMKGTTRSRAIVDARKMFFYMCRNFLPMTFSDIGHVLNKDHATVMYSIASLEDNISIYPLEKTALIDLVRIVSDRMKSITPDIKDVEEEVYMENDFYNLKTES